MDQPSVGDMEMGQRRPAQQQGQLGRDMANSWLGNDSNTLLVVATLITTLTYQVGTNIPGGYWQDTQYGKDGKLLHMAGQPIMRDLDRPRYLFFVLVNWVGLWSSVFLTVSLLTGTAGNLRSAHWPLTISYSSLVITYMVSQSVYLSFAIPYWIFVAAFLWACFSPTLGRIVRAIKARCCGGRDNST